MEFPPQTFVVHSLARVQPTPFAAAQVFVVALHCPVAQTAAAFAAVHAPSCRVSLAIAAPAASFALQVKLERSQYCAVVQSPSTQHPPTALGMQLPDTLHLLDWHSALLSAVQPAWPLS